MLEKVMYTRLTAFIAKNNILNEAQSDFQKGKSIETEIHAFLDNIHEALDKKVKLIGIFLDLPKAYYLLDHEILLFKVNAYGIRGLANQ
jgi:hypothetical protein